MTQALTPDVTVVVLNWNGRDDTLACLASLAHVTVPHRVLVVDNDSSDDSVAAIRREHPDVVLVESGWNAGFAGGCNVGLRAALAAEAEIVVILNNDTLVDADFLEPLLRVLDSQSRVALSPVIRRDDGDASVWYSGARRSPGNGWPQHSPPEEHAGALAPYRTDFLTGCCLAASAKTWREVGPFDEDYFLIFEDSDWSQRARDLGYELLVVPGSTVTHKVSASFERSRSAIGDYYFARNALLFSWRHPAAGRWSSLRAPSVNIVVRPIARDIAMRRMGSASFMRLLGMIAFACQRRGPASALTQHLSRLGHG